MAKRDNYPGRYKGPSDKFRQLFGGNNSSRVSDNVELHAFPKLSPGACTPTPFSLSYLRF